MQKTRDQYAFARNFWLNIMNSTAALNDFLKNDHGPRLKKSVENITKSGLQFIENGFKYFHESKKSENKFGVFDNPLWKNFEECSESGEVDVEDVQVLLSFVKFVEFKKMKKQFDEIEDVPIQDSVQLNL